jgi:hypothetical protein
MERYLKQLLEDIDRATENVDWPYRESDHGILDWISDEEEERIAPRRPLEAWTGIQKVQLPPADRLNDDQLHRLLKALKAMLNAHNWSFVLQTVVPERIQYAAIQDNFDQEALVKTHHMGFFQLCRPGTPHGTCALDEHCQCRFYAEFFAGFVDEDLTPEEERARALEIEVEHIKRKYGEEWRKYYPYHLDPEYDDEEGNPHDYGFGQPEEPDPGDWWRGE